MASTNLPQAVSGNTFNAANQMTAFGSQSLSYDANGNLVSDGTNTYTWDARNHLASISGGAFAAFVYDPLGRRASKTVNGTTTQFVYDGLNPVQELDGASPPNQTANRLAAWESTLISDSDTQACTSAMAAICYNQSDT